MMKKLTALLALFLLLALFAQSACGAYADVAPFTPIAQSHLQLEQNSQEAELAKIAIQPLGGAVLPDQTGNHDSYLKEYTDHDIPKIKNNVSTYASELSESTADKLLGAIGSSNASVTKNEPVWGTLGGFDHMTQVSSYLLLNGQGFRINTHAVLFDLSLLTTYSSGFKYYNSLNYFSNNNPGYNPFANPDDNSDNPPYLSLSADDFPFDIPAASVPDPGAILSASIYGPEKNNNNAWDKGSLTPWYVPSLHDSYGSMADKLAAELYLRLLMDEADPSFGHLSLQEIISKADESASGFLAGEIQAMPGHFSPYAFVWTEVEMLAAPLAAPALPETGDASPLAPWLLLLCGACALLIFAKKKSAASA